MAEKRVAAFDRTVQKTYGWLSELEDFLGADDPHKVYMTLRGVLHALRDRLTPEEAVELAAQLPMLVRGFYYEGWRPTSKPLRYRHKAEFLDQVSRETPWLKGEDLEHAVSRVFELLTSELGAEGEVAQVRNMLPADLRELWAQPAL